MRVSSGMGRAQERHGMKGQNVPRAQPRLMFPPYNVMRRIKVNPVSTPAFWIAKKMISVLVFRTCSLAIMFISGN